MLRGLYPDAQRLAPEAAPRFMNYYYPDRVEVAPVITRLDSLGSEARNLRDSTIWVATHNLTERAVVRLEIDGVTIGLDESIEPFTLGFCRAFGNPLIHRLAGPLRIRWQHAQSDAKWHEATLLVPAFRSTRAPPGVLEENRLHLFLLADGGLKAQRSQYRNNGGGRSSVRFTTPIVPFDVPPGCGVADVYNDSVQRIAD